MSVKFSVRELNEKLSGLQKVDLSVNDKLTYAIKKLNQRIKTATAESRKKYNEEVDDLRLNLAATDDKGVLLNSEDGQFLYTKDDTKLLRASITKLQEEFESSIVDFEPYIMQPDKPGYERVNELLDEFTIEELKGILI